MKRRVLAAVLAALTVVGFGAATAAPASAGGASGCCRAFR